MFSLADIPAFNDIVERTSNVLNYIMDIVMEILVLRTCCLHEHNMHLIDPIPNVFGCRELDIAKFIASLLINRYSTDLQDLSINTLLAYNPSNRKKLTLLTFNLRLRLFVYISTTLIKILLFSVLTMLCRRLCNGISNTRSYC